MAITCTGMFATFNSTDTLVTDLLVASESQDPKSIFAGEAAVATEIAQDVTSGCWPRGLGPGSCSTSDAELILKLKLCYDTGTEPANCTALMKISDRCEQTSSSHTCIHTYIHKLGDLSDQ